MSTMRITWGVVGLPALLVAILVFGAGSLALAADQSVGSAAPVADLVENLRARLEREPDDMQGWVLLARSYHYLGRFSEAEAAFAKARELGYQGEAATPKAQPGAQIDPVVLDRISNLTQSPPAQPPAATGTSGQ